MEENKYYTPEIEEFHVGFECERNSIGFDDEWHKEVVYAGFKDGIWKSNIDHIMSTLKDGCDAYRVKYLDKKDIESFGFKLYISTDDRYGFEYDIKDGNTVVGGFTDTQDEENVMLYETYFYVKNKSEFKRLLKQVGLLK